MSVARILVRVGTPKLLQAFKCLDSFNTHPLTARKILTSVARGADARHPAEWSSTNTIRSLSLLLILFVLRVKPPRIDLLICYELFRSALSKVSVYWWQP